MLTIVPEDKQLVFPEWIKRYDQLPSLSDPSFRFTIAAADLAISKKQGADCTAIVKAHGLGWGDKMKIYILPHPLNRQLNFTEQKSEVEKIWQEYGGRIKILIESNGYQQALVDESVAKRYAVVEGIKNYVQDKHARLSLVSPRIQDGTALFPRNGVDALTIQIGWIRSGKHDDLADAFMMIVEYCVKNIGHPPRPFPEPPPRGPSTWDKKILATLSFRFVK